MPEVYDERGELVGFEDDTQGQPVPPQQQTSARSYPSGAPFVTPSLQGRAGVIPTPEGGLGMPVGSPQVMAGPTPQYQGEMQAHLEQSAKAGQLDKAQKDVEQAMRFLGMRGVEKDVQGGMAYHEALSKHLPYISYGNPAQAQAYSRIIQQSQPLSMQNLDGVRVLRTPRGDRIVPKSAIPQPPVTSAQSIPFTDPATGQSVPGHFAVPSPTGRGFTVHRRADDEPKKTYSQQRLELNDRIRDKNDEIEAVPWPKENDKAGKAARQAELGRLNAELKELQAQRQGGTKKAEPNRKPTIHSAPPKSKEDRVIGDTYPLPGGKNGPAGQYRWTGQGWEPAS